MLCDLHDNACKFFHSLLGVINMVSQGYFKLA